ncbi:hypothetical protein BDW74DRAFT_185914 [Aspergillus multicolor]|uniref:uncharacterized protein n=1 Tax=Aspergillus multicolor TaxID=41759 RepID=UPI003CCDCB82
MATHGSVLRSVFNHVVLPPELPGQTDEHPEAVDRGLLRRLLSAVTVMKAKCDEAWWPTWQFLEDTLRLSSLVNDGRICNKAVLVKVLGKVSPEAALAVRIREQNAGLLIKHDEAGIIFEGFEISASAEPTLAAKGALQWDSPGCAVSIPYDVFEDPNFQVNLALFLEKASVERLHQFGVKVRKAGTNVTEDRDTSNPALITQFLMTLFEINGTRLSTPILRKRINDDLLAECVPELGSEHYHLLEIKLCRRLAKLEAEKPSIMRLIEFPCTSSIGIATTSIQKEWNLWKQENQRQIPKLPLRSDSDCYLTLPNSIEYLRSVLRPIHQHIPRTNFVEPSRLESIVVSSTAQQFATLTRRYSMLTAREVAIAPDEFDLPSTREAIKKRCIELVSSIKDYIAAVGDAYDHDSEQFSHFILCIFDMWVVMDKAATTLYPVLREFHPWFGPEMLDVLLLARFKDMRRLQDIQSNGTSTIFADPAPGCFAERYFDSPSAGALHRLQERIIEASQRAKDDKEDELEDVNNDFDDLTEKLRSKSCTLLRNPDGSHDIRGCNHCYYLRSRRRLEVKVHEDFLPLGARSEVEQKAVLLELQIPKDLAAYREVTWEIVNRLCVEINSSNYPKLQRYNENRSSTFTLASSTKSWLGTHYSWRRLPAAVRDIILPHGLRYSYYDSKRKLWVSEYPERLSVARYLTLQLPKELRSPFSALYASAAFAPNAEGPSSYDTLASISECPTALTIHEFTAHQTLVGGANRRWLSILAELGSSNVNFGLQETMVLLEANSFRVIHFMLRDEFWHTTMMETLLTLCLRLFSLGPAETRPYSKMVLLRIRQITLNWITVLREETKQAKDTNAVNTAARTFSPWLTARSALDPDDLSCFFNASIAMQESLLADLSQFSTLVSQLSELMRTSVMHDSGCIGTAINSAWFWKLLPPPYDNWVTSQTCASEGILSQTYHFHILERHLLINGKTLGKLPADIRESRLFAFPSHLSGMEWTLHNSTEKHRIHLGHREGRLIIRAEAFMTVLELVPRDTFRGDLDLDLPLHLIMDSFHWVDLRTGIRKAVRKESTLVDPCSPLAKQISRIFLHFENANRLIITQTSKTINVELKQMNLAFFVLKNGSLKCHQLEAVIDRDQDPGTFYGLQSMLVLRDNYLAQRSILVSLGEHRSKRHRSHVLVDMEYKGLYAKYTINNVLERLECPADPQLLYAKAQLHALTSHLLPDPLTGRTGTQEALDCLQSGFCQPWTPFLTPQRQYYPKGTRSNIQHDGFYPVVDAILKRSDLLSQFSNLKLGPTENSLTTPVNTSHLRERAQRRRAIFEAPGSSQVFQPEDVLYVSRDAWYTSEAANNVRDIVTLLQKQPSSITTTRDLIGLLESWPLVGGYTNSFSLYNLSDCLQVNLGEEWGGLVNMCRNAKEDDVYNLMFQLGVIAFRDGVNMTALRAIASFYVFPEFRNLEFLQHESYDRFVRDEKPTSDTLRPMIRTSYPPQPSIFKRHPWPCAEPSVEEFVPKFLNKTLAKETIMPEWTRLYQNSQFQSHLEKVQTILNHHFAATDDFALPTVPSRTQQEILGPKRKHALSLYPRLEEDLLGKQALQIPRYLGRSMEQGVLEVPELPAPVQKFDALKPPSPEILELETIVHQLGRSNCSLTPQMRVDAQIQAALADIKGYHRCISDSLRAHDSRFKWLTRGELWPSLTPTTILRQLHSTSKHDFGPGMKELFVSYALAITRLQKLLRLNEAVKKHDNSAHDRECDPGHINWNPAEFPDWILLEIDANIQIRQGQVTVAMEMISPSSGDNSVLQTNMSQGKTSVIMEMVAAVLANGAMLIRLLVPKALLWQAAQILQSRLGGLLGRSMAHVPFSRQTRATLSLIADYHQLHANTLLSSGIILSVPEHILSFKLSGLQRLADSKLTEASQMIETQNWLNEVSRDVVDECDFTLAVKTQLIYPGGAQLSVDGHPDRWEVAMALLGLCSRYFNDLAREYPWSIDILQRNSTGFPVTYLLRKAWTTLLPLDDCNEKGKEAIRLFITEDKIDKSVTKRIAKLFPDSSRSRKVVYLLRGLLVHGILILSLKKRWNVGYGIHHGRDPIAVPFHAKGVPSEQAEWGHPDVAILFTCLAFYYEGLSLPQLKRSLEAVLKSDHPATEYERWTQTSVSLPEALRHWAAITVDDAGLVAVIWRHLRYTREVINHFRCNFVFPLHARHHGSQYRSTEDLWIRPGITTGFSGTNDNRRLLPLTIKQRDLPGLSHTNAEVLTYLLQSRNWSCSIAVGRDGRRMSENALLEYLHGKNIRVLIDAGAFIMEMNNEAVAREWLKADWEAQGAVYFGDDNKPWIMHRSLKRVPLLASPFADDPNEVLVYLDEAHCRGVDLRFPVKTVGAVTLGLGQTKDQTVQAAMRLRQLGTTQSVIFIAPPEVHQSILDVQKKTSGSALDSSDVIAWLLDQTCATNRELSPLYFAQGKDFTTRMHAATMYKKFLSNPEHRKAYIETLQQPEQQTLEQLYEPKYRNDATLESSPTAFASGGRVTALMQALEAKQHQESETFESARGSALEERPCRKKGLRFPGLHGSVLDFAKGNLLRSDNVVSAAEWLENTQLGEKYKIEGSSLVPHIYLSVEFPRTIKLKKSVKDDTYTRPVNWLLYNTVTETALIVIPEEAEELIPIMRDSLPLNTHLILYAAPWTKSMLHFNDLTYYSLPSLPADWKPPVWLPFELGIIAGRLYFPFSEYADISDPLYSLSGVPGEEDETLNSWTKNRLNFLQEWLGIHRQGQDITDTPMGYICQNWPLRAGHPFFATRTVKAPDAPVFESLRYRVPDEGEEYYSSDDGLDVDVDVDDMDLDVDDNGDDGDEENSLNSN